MSKLMQRAELVAQREELDEAQDAHVQRFGEEFEAFVALRRTD